MGTSWPVFSVTQLEMEPSLRTGTLPTGYWAGGDTDVTVGRQKLGSFFIFFGGGGVA